MFRIFIANLGKYNEGYIQGEWVDLPCDDFEAVYERIGINEEYEETIILDSETDIPYKVFEYANLDKLNEDADDYERLDEYEAKVVDLLMRYGDYSFEQAMDAKDNVIVYNDCWSKGDLAHCYIDEACLLDDASELCKMYFDYESFGEDLFSEEEIYQCNLGTYIWVMR